MSDAPLSDEAEKFARMPLLVQRALLRLAFAAIDSTEREKRLMEQALDRLAIHETAPEPLTTMASQMGSLLYAVQAQVSANHLAHAQSEATNDQSKEQ